MTAEATFATIPGRLTHDKVRMWRAGDMGKFLEGWPASDARRLRRQVDARLQGPRHSPLPRNLAWTLEPVLLDGRRGRFRFGG